MRERTAKRLLEPCRSSFTAYCPTMDLVATVSKKDVIDVWRYNGQRVFGLHNDNEEGDARTRRTVEGLAWREDGRMLAVALKDGSDGRDGRVLLLDSFSGKVAHELRAEEEEESGVMRVGRSARSSAGDKEVRGEGVWKMSWHSHFANAAQIRRQLAKVDGRVGLDDLLGLNADVKKLLRAKADLPRELARIEIDASLPKLSTLPSTGADDDIFSTRQSVDAIFHAQSGEAAVARGGVDTVDVLVRVIGECVLLVSVFDSFVVGTVDIVQALPKGLQALRVVHEASHPLLTAHYLAVAAHADGLAEISKAPESLHLLSLDLRFISQTSYILPLVVGKATQLQNLLRYILQISDQLSAEVRTAFDLPSRFVENINETLAEEDENLNFMSEAYRLIITGMCHDKFREWLVDQVGDRGLKRWEKAVGDCLDMIRRITIECLAPAVERAEIVLSRLDGLSRFADIASKLGLEEKSIRAVREVLDALTIHCEDMLRDACTEIREFAAFMRWLKWETEVQTLGEDSERAEEMRESYTGEAEIRIVLDYIESAMKTSRLVRYISSDSKVLPSEDSMKDNNLFAMYEKARSTEQAEDLLKLSDLVHIVRQRSEVVFKSIAETLRKSILVSYVAELPMLSKVDSRIVAPAEGESFMLHIVGREKAGTPQLRHVALKVEADSRTSSRGLQSSTIDLPSDPSGGLLDVKVAGDDALLALVHDETSQNRAIVGRSLSGHNEAWQTRHLFAEGVMGSGMIPSQLIVNQRKDRRGVVVTDEDDIGFVVMDQDVSA
jgi:anaphase-promoting complex subunit 4